jgi:Flp pilus assembly protein TadG
MSHKLFHQLPFYADRSGASAVEFALISPLLLLMLAGIVDYGSYFSTAHGVQQMVNDAARASIAGSTAAERLKLAQGVMDSENDKYAFLSKGAADLSITEGTQVVTVTLNYKPDSDTFELFPLPPGMPDTITRSASIVRGGY